MIRCARALADHPSLMSRDEQHFFASTDRIPQRLNRVDHLAHPLDDFHRHAIELGEYRERSLIIHHGPMKKDSFKPVRCHIL